MKPVWAARGPSCPPQIELECLAAGEALAPALSEHIGACEACTAAVTALRQRAAHFRAANPADAFVARLEATQADRRTVVTGPWRRRAFGAALALGAAAAALVLVARPTRGTAASDEGDVRLKGEGLSVLVRRAGSSTTDLALSGGSVRAGDELQFQFTASRAGQLMVVDVDGDGRFTVFHPYGGSTSEAVSAATGRALLPERIVLDASRGPERVTAVFRPEPFTADEAKAWVSARVVPSQCGGCAVYNVLLEKQ